MLKKLLLFLPLVLLVVTACNPTLASAPSGLNTQDTTPIRASSPPEVTTQETTPTQVNPTSPASNPWVNVDPRTWPTPRNNDPPILPPPFRSKPSSTIEERMAWQKEMEDKGYISKTKRTVGPETMGATITIKDIQIKLPDDAFILMNVQSPNQLIVEKGPNYKPWDTPYYVLRRGKSFINVNAATGKIQGEEVAKGEEAAFDFLKKALQ